MYIEAKETARLYKLLTERLGNDTTEAMFKYIDNKTERSVEATIKTLATKDDLAKVKDDLSKDQLKGKLHSLQLCRFVCLSATQSFSTRKSCPSSLLSRELIRI